MSEFENPVAPLKRFLRLRQVQEITGKSKSSIYEDITNGRFPRPVPLGEAANSPVAWLEDEIAAWQADRIARRTKQVAV